MLTFACQLLLVHPSFGEALGSRKTGLSSGLWPGVSGQEFRGRRSVLCALGGRRGFSVAVRAGWRSALLHSEWPGGALVLVSGWWPFGLCRVVLRLRCCLAEQIRWLRSDDERG